MGMEVGYLVDCKYLIQLYFGYNNASRNGRHGYRVSTIWTHTFDDEPTCTRVCFQYYMLRHRKNQSVNHGLFIDTTQLK